MKITIVEDWRDFAALSPTRKQESLTGKWHHYKRIYILKDNDKFTVVSLNVFQRMQKALYQILRKDYFKIAFRNKNVEVILPSLLKGSNEKTDKVSQQTLQINQTSSLPQTSAIQNTASSTNSSTLPAIALITNQPTSTSSSTSSNTSSATGSSSNSNPQPSSTMASATSQAPPLPAPGSSKKTNQPASPSSSSSASSATGSSSTSNPQPSNGTPTPSTPQASPLPTPGSSSTTNQPASPSSSSSASSATGSSSTSNPQPSNGTPTPSTPQASPLPTPGASSTTNQPASPSSSSSVSGQPASGTSTAALKIDEKKLIQTMYHGFNTQSHTIDEFSNLASKLEVFSQDRTIQEKEYGNNDPNHIYIDFNDFGKSNNLYGNDLQILSRYMVLNEKIAGYKQARVGYCLYLTKESIPTNPDHPVFTKEKLMEIDDYMSKLQWPSASSEFAQTEREIFDKAIKSLTSQHYCRVVNNSHDAFTMYELDRININSSGEKVLDYLVEKGTIDSWNASQRTYQACIKIKNADDVKDNSTMLRWEKWRDITVIKAEKEFKKNNHIEVPQADLLKSSLSSGEEQALQDLVKELNKRRGPGKHTWYSGFPKVVDFLKARGSIYDYQRVNWSNTFDLYVKPEDNSDLTK